MSNHSSRPIQFREYLPEVLRGDERDAPSFQNRFLQAFEDLFEELQSVIEGVPHGDLRLTVDSVSRFETGSEKIEIKLKPPLETPPEFPVNTFVTLAGIGSSLFSVGDFIDLPALVAKLRTQDPISKYLWNQFPASTQEVLTSATSTPEEQKLALVQALDNILKGVLMYETVRFAGVVLSPETLTLKSLNPQGTDLIRLNRLLLEDAYPLEIAKSPGIDADSTTLAEDYPGVAGAASLFVRDTDFVRSVGRGSEIVLHAGGLPDLFNPDLTPPPQFARRLQLKEYRAEPESAFLNFLASWIGLPLRDELIPRANETDLQGQLKADDPGYERRKARWNRHLIRTAVGIYPRRGTRAGVEAMLRAWLKDDIVENRVTVTDLLRTHTDVDTVFQLDVARVGVDTVLGEGPPFFFLVDLTVNPTVPGLRNPRGIDVLLREARFILESETPAHTYYQLRVRANTMQLAPSPGEESSDEIYAQIGQTTQLWDEPFVWTVGEGG